MQVWHQLHAVKCLQAWLEAFSTAPVIGIYKDSDALRACQPASCSTSSMAFLALSCCSGGMLSSTVKMSPAGSRLASLSCTHCMPNNRLLTLKNATSPPHQIEVNHRLCQCTILQANSSHDVVPGCPFSI